MPLSTETSGYRISPRVVLEPGDSFKVAGGPYYKTRDGQRLPLAARGTFRLMEVIRRRSRVYLLAHGAEGWAMLHVEGRRRSPVPGLVPRPYRVTRRVTTTGQRGPVRGNQ
jgi:hypothetical protein